MQPLRQSTVVTVNIGPFVDNTDFKTAETGLTFSVKLSKAGAAYVAGPSATHNEDGDYTISLTTSHTDTLGSLRVKAVVAGALIVWRDFMVIPQPIYDALYGGTLKLDTNVFSWSGTAVATPHTAGYPVVTIKDGTGTGEIDTASGGVSVNGFTTAAKAELQTEANDALVANNLDHLLAAAVAGTDVVDNSVFAKIVSKSATADWDTYVNTTDSLEAQRDNIGTTGTALVLAKTTNIIGFNDVSAAQVNAEVDTAIVDYRLDHLLFASVAGADVTDNSVFARLVSKAATADWDTFVNTTDSLEGIRDALSSGGAPTAAEVADAVWDELRSGHTGAGSFGQYVLADMVRISDDTTAANNLEALLDGTGGVSLTASEFLLVTPMAADVRRWLGTNAATPTVAGVPEVDITHIAGAVVNTALAQLGVSVVSHTTAAKAEIEAEANDAIVANRLDHLLAVAVAGTDVTDNSVIAKMVSKSATADWDSFNNTTESLEALRDRGDVAWITATGFSTLTQADVRTAVGLASANLDTQLGDIEAIATGISSDTTELTNRLTLLRAENLDFLDASVASRSSHTAGDVWTSGVRTLTASLDPSLTQIVNGVWDELKSAHTVANSFGDFLDVEVSSRLATASYTVPPTAGAIADQVWDEDATAHQTSGTFGFAIGDPGVSSVTIHSRVAGNLDVAVSSRSSHSAADTWTVGTRTLTAFGFNVTVATNLDKTGYGLSAAAVDDIWNEAQSGHTTAGTFGKYLDVEVSSRLATASYVTPPTAGAIADAVWDEDATAHQTTGTFGLAIGDPGASASTIWSTVITNLNATVSSRSSHNAADVWVSGTRTLTASLDPTASQIADQVWDEVLAGHLTSGTTGAALNAASSAGDPWATVLPGAYGAGTAGKIIGDNINATISSRSSHSAADTWAVGTRTLTASLDPTANQIADQVWDELIAGHLTSGSTGEKLNIASAATDPWSVTIPGAYGAGTAGKILGDRLDAAVSTRSSHSAADVWGVATRTLTAFSFQVTVATNLDKTGYTLSALGVDAIWDEAQSGHITAGTFGKYLDVEVSSRLATAGYTVPPTVLAIADQVWDEMLAGHLTAGSTGFALNAASSAGDPWATTLPGAYSAGTAGHIIGNRLDVGVGTRSSHTAADVWAVGTRTLTASLDPTLSQIVNGVWNELKADHTVPNSFGDYLDIEVSSRLAALGPVTDAANQFLTMVQVDGPVWQFTTNALENTPIQGTGTGARTVLVHVTDEDDIALSGATVRLTKGAETFVASTNIAGEITFNVDDGVWIVAITKPGYSFTQTALVVDGNEEETYVLTQTVLPTSDPGLTTGFLVTYNEQGVVEPNVGILAVVSGPNDVDNPPTGWALDNTERWEHSDVNGLVQFPNLFKGVKYQFSRGDSPKKYFVEIPLDAGPTYELPIIIGQP